MRIAFFGTPTFAVPTLHALLTAGHDVALVVSQPDRPQRRSRSTLVPPPVKVAALEAGLAVIQPELPTGEAFLSELRGAHADVGVVVAYGHILRQTVLATPLLGMINVHASILPRWRGAAPIQSAILAGDPLTGVSIMQMEAGLDSGPVFRCGETPIGPTETHGELEARLAMLGAETLIAVLAELGSGVATTTRQDATRVTFAPKIDRTSARIDWHQDADAVARRIRAFDPEPGAWATLDGGEFKVFGASVVDGYGAPGAIIGTRDGLTVATGRGAVRLSVVQPAGRSRVEAAAWARGQRELEGKVLA